VEAIAVFFPPLLQEERVPKPELLGFETGTRRVLVALKTKMDSMAPPHRELTTDKVRERIRAAGLRVTASRVAVVEHLQQARSPMTHAQVFAALAPRGWDRVTLYRNLMDLTEASLLQRTDVGDHVWRFELRGVSGRSEHADVEHPHFVCSDCGEVECLPAGIVRVSGGRGLPRSLHGGALEVQIKGRCDRCA